MYVKIESSIETTMKSLYDLLWGQYSKTLRSRLRGHDDYTAYSTSADSIALLKAVRAKMTGARNTQTYRIHYIRPCETSTIYRKGSTVPTKNTTTNLIC
jgi:hypothetical protein